MKEINLYIDESGNLGKEGRYFLICALEVEPKFKKTLSKRAGRVINRFKQERKISKKQEIKGWQLNTEERKLLLEKILFKGIKIRYLVLDLEKTTMLLTKSDDKNACYNYLIQLLVKSVLKAYPLIKKINLHLDNRTVKIGHRLALKPYLYNKLVLEQLETSIKFKKIDFEITYYESQNCYLIEWADIIANSLFKKYNRNESFFYNIIKPYIIYESKFPSKKFGK